MNPEAEPLGGIERELGSQILRGLAGTPLQYKDGCGILLAPQGYGLQRGGIGEMRLELNDQWTIR